MSFQSMAASIGGDTWASKKLLAVWPWPAVIVGNHTNMITGDDYRCFSRLIKPGDFLLTNCSSYFLSNLFIAKRNGTAFSHLAVYTGAVSGWRDQRTGFILKAAHLKDEDSCDNPGRFKKTVTHAISEGVVVEDLFDLFKHMDWMAAVRPWKDIDQQEKIVKAALSQVGLEYNFDFNPGGPPSSYCTELGAYCLKAAGLPEPAKNLSVTSLAGILVPVSRFKSEVYMADYFIRDFDMVCCSLSCGSTEFLRRSKVEGFRKKLLEAPDASNYVEE
jgi:hypothetical protein